MLNIDIFELKSFKNKSLGLLKFKNKALYFQTRFGVHTFLVSNPIDVIILDRKNKIRTLKKELLPNRIFLWNPKYCRVLELVSGTIEKLDLKVNDILEFNL